MYLINSVQVEKKDFIIPVENMGVWRGDGVFEAIKIHDGYPFAIDLHIERLARSCSKVFFENIDYEKIKDDIIFIANEHKDGYVRTLILRSEHNSHDIFCFYQPPISISQEFSLQTQKAFWQSGGDYDLDSTFNIGTKSTSYGMNISHTRAAEQDGFTDALLVNKDEIILEGPTFTFGWINNNKIYVPDLKLGILDSITRKYLIKFGVEKKLTVLEARIKISDLDEIDACFVLSTAKHAVPVFKINEIEYSDHDLITEIQNVFSEQIRTERTN